MLTKSGKRRETVHDGEKEEKTCLEGGVKVKWKGDN